MGEQVFVTNSSFFLLMKKVPRHDREKNGGAGFGRAPGSRVHLTGGKSPVTSDFYRYRYLAATLTGSGNRCFPIQNLKIQKTKKQLPLQ